MSKYPKYTKEPGPVCHASLNERMALEVGDPARLTITPLLTSAQVGEGHIDLRLGYGFIVPSKATWNYVGHQVQNTEGTNQRKTKKYAETWINPDDKFTLHPGQLVLASTLEYVQIPLDISAQVGSKSSWGRLGVLVSTATLVHPGFQGVLTLELFNAGELPIELKVGTSIAQLWMVGMSTSSSKYNGSFKCPVGPEAPNITELYDKMPHFNFDNKPK